MPLMGSKNTRNLDSMVAAGIITKSEADRRRKKAAKNAKSLLGKKTKQGKPGKFAKRY